MKAYLINFFFSREKKGALTGSSINFRIQKKTRFAHTPSHTYAHRTSMKNNTKKYYMFVLFANVLQFNLIGNALNYKKANTIALIMF